MEAPSSSIYTGEQGKIYQEQVHGLNENGYLIVAKARAKKFQSFIKTNASVLEFGVGNGWDIALLHAAKKIGYDVYIDSKIDWNKYNIECTTDKKKIPFAYFDTVICHHVLEHVENPLDELRLMKQFIKPDGELLLYVPFEKGKRFEKYNSKDVNHHIYSWNVQSFCNLVEQAGLQIKAYKVLTKGYDRFAASLVLKFKFPEKFYYFIRSVLQTIKPEKEIMIQAILQ